MTYPKILALTILLTILIPSVLAAHYVVGRVNDALDLTPANGKTIISWSPVQGISFNVTDIIGANGNSGTDNIYMLDCELLDVPCDIGNILNVKVLNEDGTYTSQTTQVTITGAAYDLASELTLNSPPNVTLISPVNFANLSVADIPFSCAATDLDSNLANVTLYGNWSGAWAKNKTLLAPSSKTTLNFPTPLVEGRYSWNCMATDDLGISRFASSNFSVTVDRTPPAINSVEFNASTNLCKSTDYVRVNCTTSDALSGVKRAIIEANTPTTKTNYTAAWLTASTYYADVVVNEEGIWNFTCHSFDESGNSVSKISSALNRAPLAAQLRLTSSEITFSSDSPVENTLLSIDAKVQNIGCAAANNFLVTFYEGPSENSKTQLGTPVSISTAPFQNTTATQTWTVQIGSTNFFASADSGGSIAESDETDNNASRHLDVTAWQELYGNVTVNKILATESLRNVSKWGNTTLLGGNIFIADKESSIDWFSLKALGKNKVGDSTYNDFAELDSLLSMDSLADSIASTFTTDGNSPVSTDSFQINRQDVSAVPIINSTNSTNFITGILWDSSDDLDGEFSYADAEDIIFVTKINKLHPGYYGNYDYEIKIPARLREYNPTDTNEVFIYYDLN